MDVFSDYAYYYNLFYGDKDYKKEAQVLDGLIKKYSTNAVKDILDMGCGTGRHDIELCHLGYKVRGIDLSENMIQIAKNTCEKGASEADFQLADVRTYNPDRKYDAVVSMFHVMSYQCRNDDIINAFQTAAKCLNSGGVFVFDAWYGPGVLSERPEVRVKEVADDNNTVIRYAVPTMYPERNVVDVCYRVMVIDKKTDVCRSLEEVHSMRYFFSPEIEHLLSLAGFKMEACLDCNTLEKTGFDSWTAYFVATRL